MLDEWLHYGLRLFHLIAGIMWIGTSFYFVWLDFSFEPLPPERAKESPSVDGETYMVHGGFFYRVEKQKPTKLPPNLHWFKYEALLTYVSGFLLLLLVYWTGGGMALMGPTRIPLTHPHVAYTVSLGSLVAAWFLYDTLWRLIGKSQPTLALVVSVLGLVGAIYGYCSVFPGRAAFIHTGAMIGTIMICNVWVRILPAQRRMIAKRLAGEEPDWAEGAAAKQRSLHNSYVTIPVLFTMISNHFSFAFDHPLNWAILCGLAVIGASVRHLMITIERQQTAWWAFAPATAAFAMVVFVTWPAPRPEVSGPPVAFAEANDILARRCRQCHSATPTDDVFHSAPNGVMFDSPASIVAYAPRIRLRACEARTMPLANKTEMTDEERETLQRWIDQGAHTN
ncbi:MAG: urate hydroxylase PuuD [Sandaracinaceae bacterium]|nr:urate hydroxylase PuuD [Sandaracinaceae bacterium]